MHLLDHLKGCDPTVPPRRDDPEIESAFDLIRSSLRWAREEELGSEDALGQLKLAIKTVTGLFRNHIDAALPRPVESPQFQGDAALGLSLFMLAEGFLGPMARELSLALASLQIGEVRLSVRPRSRRGGASAFEQLVLKRIIVGAADRLKALAGCDAAYRCELEKRGLNSRTIEDYRRQIARTQHTNQPAAIYDLEGAIDACIVLARDELRKGKTSKNP